MKYYVFYTEGCNPKIKQFEKQESMYRFVALFTLQNLDTKSDNWVDVVVKGELIASEAKVEVEIK